MATSIYIVLFVRGHWFIDLDGVSDGPFTSLESARAEAVARAAATSRRGGRSEVRVAGPGHENELIYQSTRRRAVAEALH